jgi:hypothetical protein
MRDLVIPKWAEKIIKEQEEKLTAEVREMTGRDDIFVIFDREKIDVEVIPNPHQKP